MCLHNKNTWFIQQPPYQKYLIQIVQYIDEVYTAQQFILCMSVLHILTQFQDSNGFFFGNLYLTTFIRNLFIVIFMQIFFFAAAEIPDRNNFVILLCYPQIVDLVP